MAFWFKEDQSVVYTGQTSCGFMMLGTVSTVLCLIDYLLNPPVVSQIPTFVPTITTLDILDILITLRSWYPNNLGQVPLRYTSHVVQSFNFVNFVSI